MCPCNALRVFKQGWFLLSPRLPDVYGIHSLHRQRTPRHADHWGSVIRNARQTPALSSSGPDHAANKERTTTTMTTIEQVLFTESIPRSHLTTYPFSVTLHFPESHPLWLWPGFGDAAPPFVRAVASFCDATLAIGCRFGEVATGSYGVSPPRPLVHVDIDPAEQPAGRLRDVRDLDAPFGGRRGP